MDFNSRYYLIESVQQVVDAIGSNCVLSGLNINYVTLGRSLLAAPNNNGGSLNLSDPTNGITIINDLPGPIGDDPTFGGDVTLPSPSTNPFDLLRTRNHNDLVVNLSKGKVICDSTLIDFPDDLELILDLGTLPTQGRIILSVNYRYLRTSRPNFAAFSLKYLNNDSICTEWFPETDKIVLAVINYNKLTPALTFQYSTITNNSTITINNIQYEITPFNYTIQQLRPYLI